MLSKVERNESIASSLNENNDALIAKSISPRHCRTNIAYVLRPHVEEPTELAVSRKNDVLAIADGKNGLVLLDFDGKLLQHFRLSISGSVRGVCFHEHLVESKVVVLWLEDDSNWFISIYPFENKEIKDETIEECLPCPVEEGMQSGIDMKTTLLDGVLYLLSSGANGSMIWTMNMSTFIWKTLIVERNKSALAAPQSLLLCQKVKTQEEPEKSLKEFNHTYTSFDVRRWSSAQIRIVLCEAEKARLHILCISSSGEHLLETQVVKVKRSQSQRWIVQGPRLAIWDEEKIIVYDGSGKIFWFNDVNYRIQKIIADMGKGEIAALQKSNDWCFVLNKEQKCVHAFYYGCLDKI